MLDIRQLNPDDILKLYKLRQKLAVIETEIGDVLAAAMSRPPPLSAQLCDSGFPRPAQPSLRAVLSGILKKAEAPLTVAEIYEATLMTGYRWRSRNPINALNVKMYTDKTFKVASPGRFVLRDNEHATKNPKSRSKA